MIGTARLRRKASASVNPLTNPLTDHPLTPRTACARLNAPNDARPHLGGPAWSTPRSPSHPSTRCALRPNLSDYDRARAGWSWDAVRERARRPAGRRAQQRLRVPRPPREGRAPRQARDALGGQERRAGDATPSRRSRAMSNKCRERACAASASRRATASSSSSTASRSCYVAVFGTLKAGCVIGPLFSAFGPGRREGPPRGQRREGAPDQRPSSGARVEAIRSRPARRCKHVVIVDARQAQPSRATASLLWDDLIDAAVRRVRDRARPAPKTTRSCTTPPARPASRRAPRTSTRRSSGHYATGKYVLDLHDDDIYWCTADPGWVTGTSYGMFAPCTQRRDSRDLRGRLLAPASGTRSSRSTRSRSGTRRRPRSAC